MTKTKSKSLLSNPIWIVAIIVVGFAALKLASRPRSSSTLIAAADRRPAAEVIWPLPDGADWNIADHRGKIVVVNVFATWCPPCVREMPDIVKVVNDLQPKGVAALAVSLDDTFAPVPAFAEKWKINFPIAHGRNDPKSLAFESIPVTLLYDRQGRSAKVHIGMITEAELRGDLEKLIAEAP